MKTKKAKITLKYILILVLVCVMSFCFAKIVDTVSEYKEGDDTYDLIRSVVSFPDKNIENSGQASAAEPDASRVSESDSSKVSDDFEFPSVDFVALKTLNPDIVGWIYIEDTVINYPIVQCGDNSFYLDHMADKTKNSAGCIFLDCENSPDFSDKNSVIYGHHMKNGSMFGSIVKYKEQTFYDTHKTGCLMTPEKNYRIIFFAGCVANIEDNAWQTEFPPKGFEPWYRKAISHSTFNSGICPTLSDRIITLSTCSYEFDNARYVLLGILR